MMKKLFILSLTPLFVAGCYNEQESSIDSSVNPSFSPGNITLENALTKTTSTLTTGTIDISTLDANGAISACNQFTHNGGCALYWSCSLNVVLWPVGSIFYQWQRSRITQHRRSTIRI